MKSDPNRKKSVDLIYDVISRSDPKFNGYKAWYYEIVSKLELWYNAEGNHGIKRMKQILNTLVQLSLKEDIEPLSYVKSDKDLGFIPDILRPILPYLSKPSTKSLSIILTVSRLTDLYDGVPDDASVDSLVETIQGPKAPLIDSVLLGKDKYENKGFIDFLTKFFDFHKDLPFVRELKIGIQGLSGLTEGTLLSVKAGPNSSREVKKTLGLTQSDIDSSNKECYLPGSVPAFLGVYHDFKAINDDGLCHWISKLQQILTDEIHSNAFSPSSLLTEAGSLIDTVRAAVREETFSGRIAALGEKSGKIRHVALGDHFSQVTLKPLHEKLFKILRMIPNDCTFDQKKLVETFQRWTSENRFTASFDQSSCTDLFPIELQLETVAFMISDPNRGSFKECLENVLVGRDFLITYPKSGLKKKVRYTRGQPMGLYGSWAMMALTHHMLVMYSHYLASGAKLSKRMFSDYAVLGDDIVIADQSTASKYLSLCQDLGMKINKLKSHITGKSTGIKSNIEFAKLNIWKGKLLQPIRPHLVYQSFKDKGALGAVSLLQAIQGNGVLRVNKKHCKSLIERYFKKHRRILEFLVGIPTPLGGIGYQGMSVNDIVSINLRDGSLNPIYLYLARKLMSQTNETISKEESLGYLAIFESSSLKGVPEKFYRYCSRSFESVLRLEAYRVPTKLKLDESMRLLFATESHGLSDIDLSSLDLPRKVNPMSHKFIFDDERDLSLALTQWEKVLDIVDSYRVMVIPDSDQPELTDFVVLKKNDFTKHQFKENVLEQGGEIIPIPGEEVVVRTTPFDCLKVKDYLLKLLDASVKHFRPLETGLSDLTEV